MTDEEKKRKKSCCWITKGPPAYKEGRIYKDWRLDINLWNTFTSYNKKRRATAFLLELLEGPVKNHIRSLGKEVLTAEDGLDKVNAWTVSTRRTHLTWHTEHIVDLKSLNVKKA